jgi:molybdenum cofactor synthesis domain-containing protein
MRVALVTVGDEILTGDTPNTNAAWLGEQLTGQGVTVERMTVVPDRVADIARVVNEYRAEYDAVVVTGGLGPTHDDVTMSAVAAAFGTDLAPDEAVRERLHEQGYTDDDLAPGTLRIPERGESLPNPRGVAPGCVVGTVYVLPGPPAEMRAMFEQIRDQFDGETTHVETVETPEPEKQLLDRIAGVRETFDVTLGSYPGDTVTLKIQSNDPEEVAAAVDWLRERVDPVE